MKKEKLKMCKKIFSLVVVILATIMAMAVEKKSKYDLPGLLKKGSEIKIYSHWDSNPPKVLRFAGGYSSSTLISFMDGGKQVDYHVDDTFTAKILMDYCKDTKSASDKVPADASYLNSWSCKVK